MTQMSPDELDRLVRGTSAALPRNATPFERASVAAHFFHSLDVPLDDLWNPAKCPEKVLPFLAWALSVDIWYDDWPVEKKRSVCADSFELHSLKGTLEGVRRYVALVDGEVAHAIVPPAKSFLSASLTLEERREFLRSLPEIRVRDYAQPGLAGDGAFCGPLYGGLNSFDQDSGGMPASFFVESQAPKLMGRRAELRDHGEVTPLGIETVRDPDGTLIHGAERYFVPGDGTGGSFLTAGPEFNLFFCEPKAPAQVVTVSIEAAALDDLWGLTTARESMFPVPIRPEMVREQTHAPDGVFTDSICHGFHYVENRAALSLYTSMRLHDPRRDVLNRVAISFMGTERFGIAPHTAELGIAVMSQRSPWVADEFIAGFFVETDNTKLERVLDAVSASKAAHEKILVDIAVDRPPVLGGEIFLGAFRLGLPVRG